MFPLPPSVGGKANSSLSPMNSVTSSVSDGDIIPSLRYRMDCPRNPEELYGCNFLCGKGLEWFKRCYDFDMTDLSTETECIHCDSPLELRGAGSINDMVSKLEEVKSPTTEVAIARTISITTTVTGTVTVWT